MASHLRPRRRYPSTGGNIGVIGPQGRGKTTLLENIGSTRQACADGRPDTDVSVPRIVGLCDSRRLSFMAAGCTAVCQLRIAPPPPRIDVARRRRR
ncbi:MAG: hypothetical protein ACLT3W_05500 [Bifidobacterium pseudocatenulatum]